MDKWEIRLDGPVLKIFGPGPMRIFIREFNPELTSVTDVNGLVEALYPLSQEMSPGSDTQSLRVVIDARAGGYEQQTVQSFMYELGTQVLKPGTWLSIGDLVEWYVEPDFARRLVAALQGRPL